MLLHQSQVRLATRQQEARARRRLMAPARPGGACLLHGDRQDVHFWHWRLPFRLPALSTFSNQGEIVDSTDGVVSSGARRACVQRRRSLVGPWGCTPDAAPEHCSADYNVDCCCNGTTTACAQEMCSGQVYDGCGCMTRLAAGKLTAPASNTGGQQSRACARKQVGL